MVRKPPTPHFGKTTYLRLRSQHGAVSTSKPFAYVTYHKSNKPLALVACKQKPARGKAEKKKMVHKLISLSNEPTTSTTSAR